MFLFRALTAVAGSIPDHMVPLVAGALAPVHFLGFPERRRALLANLEIATRARPAPRAVLALRVCAAYNAYLLEFLRLARLSPAEVCARTSVRGEEHWRRARERGRGVVFTTSHVGNWEWGAAWLAAQGVPVAAVADVQLTRALHPHVESMKRRHGVEIVSPSGGYRALYRRLAEGGVVGLMLDGNVFRGGRAAPLFGRPVRFGAGAARLSQRTGAPLLHGTIARVGAVRFAIEIDAPIGGLEPQSRGPEELDALLRAAQQRALEKHLAQWCIFRALWRDEARAA